MSSSPSIALAIAMALAACGSSGDDKAKPAQPDNTTASSKAPSKTAAPAKRKPRGADAYTGKREVKQGGDLGKASDGTLLAATDGAERKLSSFYADKATLVVFYRGHW